MSKISVHQRKARDFIQREDWGNALSELQRMLNADADNPTLHNQIGDVFLRKDEVLRACEHFERAVDLYATVGLHNNAVALCKKVMRLRPGRFEMRYRLARLRLDQGFRGEAVTFFTDYLEHVTAEAGNADVIEAHCREMMQLVPDEAPLPKILEKLEAAGRYVAAFEIVRTRAQQAADAGDDAAARRCTEKMRSLRLLVEKSGGRDLLAGLGATDEAALHPVGSVPGGSTPVVEIPPFPAATPPASSTPAPQSASYLQQPIDAAFLESTLGGVAVNSGASLESPSLLLPELDDLDVAMRSVDEHAGGDLAHDEAPGRDGATLVASDPQPDFEVPIAAPRAARFVEAQEPGPGDQFQPNPGTPFFDVGALADEARAQPPIAHAAGPDVEARTPTSENGTEYDLPETTFADLALELGESHSTATAPTPMGNASPSWSEQPEPAKQSQVGWVESLRHAPVWIPADAADAPDTDPWKHGSSMELESVIDTFREQMARALDGDGAARYDLGVAYFDMGLYNEALAEFEAAAHCPGLEVQSYEMLAACLLQTGRHVDVVELLLPVLAAEGHSPRGRVGLQYSLGLAYEALGDWEQARRCFEEVALVDIDFKDVQVRLQRG